MSIRGNLSGGLIDLAAVSVDTVLFDNVNRTAITAMSIHNTSAGNRIVNIYISSDLTSASGTIVAVYDLAAGESIDVAELIAQGLTATEQIIAVQQTGGAALGDLNCKLTYTEYTGSS